MLAYLKYQLTPMESNLFADPHLLTLLESHLFKKGGGEGLSSNSLKLQPFSKGLF